MTFEYFCRLHGLDLNNPYSDASKLPDLFRQFQYMNQAVAASETSEHAIAPSSHEVNN